MLITCSCASVEATGAEQPHMELQNVSYEHHHAHTFSAPPLSQKKHALRSAECTSFKRARSVLYCIPVYHCYVIDPLGVIEHPVLSVWAYGTASARFVSLYM
jgi:hypothetical protein